MIRRAAFTALLLSALAGAAQAQDESLAVGVTAGTTGVGAEARLSLGPIFVLRGGVDTLGFDIDADYDDIAYGGRLDFDTVGGFVDLHPLANGFLISGGAYAGDRLVVLTATPSAPVNIGGQTYTAAQVGTLEGRIKLADVAPFVGLGYDNTFSGYGRWGFRATAGVAWSEEPEVALTSSGGTLSNDPTFRARLADEAEAIQAEADGYGVFPVVQIGLNYRF